MENKPALAKQMTSIMIQTAFESLAGMKELAQEFLDSGIVPSHFYKKGADNKPDLTKGDVSKVVIVWMKGDQLGLHPMTALQEIVPVNGLLSIKGDGAKSLILSSGKIEPGSWKEETKGSIANEDYEVTITAQRSDTKEVLSRSFSITQAKRAGLWVTDQMIKGQDGWKYQKSAWWKYPDRMVKYRALGFLARDLFSDVMNGTVTVEEAQDYPQDKSITIDVGEAQVVIPDKEFSQSRSETLTHKASELVEKKAGNVGQAPVEKKETPMPGSTMEKADPYPAVEQEEGEKFPRLGDKERTWYPANLNNKIVSIPVYTEQELMNIEVKLLIQVVENDNEMIMAMNADPGRNTNKKLRTIILSRYDDSIAQLIQKFNPEYKPTEVEPEPESETQGEDIQPDPTLDNTEDDEIPMEAAGDPEEGPEAEEALAPNEDFENKEEDGNAMAGNKQGIVLTEVPEGEDKRSFEVAMEVYNDLSGIAGIDNQRYLDLLPKAEPLEKYTSKEDLCFKASVGEINSLLNLV